MNSGRFLSISIPNLRCFAAEICLKVASTNFPISTKLIEMMRLAFAKPFDDNCEIVSVLKSLAHRRNRHVHLRPEIGSWEAEAGGISANNRLPAVDAKSATVAAEEMETFFKLFSELDGEAAFMLGIP